MASKYLHEEIYRGAESVAKLAKPLVTICGAGALGSHLADNLARQGFRQIIRAYASPDAQPEVR